MTFDQRNSTFASSSYFSFGKNTGLDSILPNDGYGNYERLSDETIYITVSTLEYGLGLSEDLYDRFTELISVGSAGNVFCPKTPNSYCLMPKSCYEYNYNGAGGSFYPEEFWFRLNTDSCNTTNVTMNLFTFMKDSIPGNVNSSC